MENVIQFFGFFEQLNSIEGKFFLWHSVFFFQAHEYKFISLQSVQVAKKSRSFKILITEQLLVQFNKHMITETVT